MATSLLFSTILCSQVNTTLPVTCGFSGGSNTAQPESSAPACTNTSPLWSLTNLNHLPKNNARAIRVRANFIIVQRFDGSGNFQDTPEDRAFLQDCVDFTNERLSNFWGNSNCSPLSSNSYIQIVPNFIFLPDPDPNNFNWDNDNNPGSLECPGANWWLNNLDATINNNPAIPRGINVYLTNDGSVYDLLVTNELINNPEDNPYEVMSYVWCSEWPNSNNLNAPSRISVTNLYLKYHWFKNNIVNGEPFSVTRGWLVRDNSLAHEFGHSFITLYVHLNSCTNHLMTSANGDRTVLREVDVANIHRNLAMSNLRQFVECDESLNPAGTHPSSETWDKVITDNQFWDANMRVYSNITVKSGATLTITCRILMPQQGVIKVERGGKLVVNGGTVTRANTCNPMQYWDGIYVEGNANKDQPLVNASLVTDDAGVVELRNEGMIEGAVIGVRTERLFSPGTWSAEYWGGLVDANDFTFRDCRKAVAFMKYDRVNHSRFLNTIFTKTDIGFSKSGVSIWDTDGIYFEECTFDRMATEGIRSIDAVYNVSHRNRFGGSAIGIHAGATFPLSGEILVGQLGLLVNDVNRFKGNTVGIKGGSGTKFKIILNEFSEIDFAIAMDGKSQSRIWSNLFANSAGGNQFKNTDEDFVQLHCNHYVNNNVGTHIIGKNRGLIFDRENYNSQYHDLFLQGTTANPGAILFNQGTIGAARRNLFTLGKPEQIKTSTLAPNDVTETFTYFHPNVSVAGNPGNMKPLCAINDICMPHSNFTNESTDNFISSACVQLEPPVACETKPCLDAVRVQVSQKQAQVLANPNSSALKGELNQLIVQKEYITEELMKQYSNASNWAALESMLNEELTTNNRRRLYGSKVGRNLYNEAQSLLQSFPQSTLDDQYFVQVQNINLQRLSTPNFQLSSSQRSVLENIATADSKDAGYAQSILGLLEEQIYMPQLPDLKGEETKSNDRSSSTSRFHELKVNPNPANDILNIEMAMEVPSNEFFTIELHDIITTKLIYSQKVSGIGSISISTAEVHSGIYTVSLVNEYKRVIAQSKIAIQH